MGREKVTAKGKKQGWPTVKFDVEMKDGGVEAHRRR